MTRIQFWNTLCKRILRVSALSILLSRVDCSRFFATNMFILTGIYDTVISTLEDPRVWDTREGKRSAFRAVYDIPVGDAREYARGRTGDPRNTGHDH